jgi:Alcohol dehydrogenase GroES-associated
MQSRGMGAELHSLVTQELLPYFSDGAARVKSGTLAQAEHWPRMRITPKLPAVLERMMKALVYHGRGDIRCDTVPDPKIEEVFHDSLER